MGSISPYVLTTKVIRPTDEASIGAVELEPITEPCTLGVSEGFLEVEASFCDGLLNVTYGYAYTRCVLSNAGM